jgi:hypothetical protein
MIELKCTSNNEKLYLIDSLGIKMRDGYVFTIEDQDINNPEVKAFIRLGILSADTPEATLEIKEELKESLVTFKCTLPRFKRMTIDSIKGTVQGQCVIGIPLNLVNNQDIKMAVNTGYLIKVEEGSKELEKAVEVTKESAKPKEVQQIIKDMYEDEKPQGIADISLDTTPETIKDNNKILELDEVSISEVTESDSKKKAQPKFRVNDEKKAKLNKIGMDIYSEEASKEPVKATAKKRGRPAKAKTEVKAPAKKRGRPAKAKTEVKAEVKAPAKKRGRPAKAKTEVKAPAKKRGRPAKAK